MRRSRVIRAHSAASSHLRRRFPLQISAHWIGFAHMEVSALSNYGVFRSDRFDREEYQLECKVTGPLLDRYQTYFTRTTLPPGALEQPEQRRQTHPARSHIHSLPLEQH